MFQLFMHVFYWHHPWRRVISAAKAPLTCTDSCSLAAHSILVVRLRHSLLSWPFVYPTASSLRVSPLIAMCLLRATDHQSSMALRPPPPPLPRIHRGFLGCTTHPAVVRNEKACHFACEYSWLGSLARRLFAPSGPADSRYSCLNYPPHRVPYAWPKVVRLTTPGAGLHFTSCRPALERTFELFVGKCPPMLRLSILFSN